MVVVLKLTSPHLFPKPSGKKAFLLSSLVLILGPAGSDPQGRLSVRMLNTSKSAKSLMSQETSHKPSFILHIQEVIRNIPMSYRGLASGQNKIDKIREKTVNNINPVTIVNK